MVPPKIPQVPLRPVDISLGRSCTTQRVAVCRPVVRSGWSPSVVMPRAQAKQKSITAFCRRVQRAARSRCSSGSLIDRRVRSDRSCCLGRCRRWPVPDRCLALICCCWRASSWVWVVNRFGVAVSTALPAIGKAKTWPSHSGVNLTFASARYGRCQSFTAVGPSAYAQATSRPAVCSSRRESA